MINVSGISQIAVEKKENNMTDDVIMAEIAKLTAELQALKVGNVSKEKKNQKPGKANASRKYVLLNKKMADWGKVPQQQHDLADLLSKGMEVGKEYSEPEVFNMLIDGAGDYPSIYSSVQDPTYLFRYYRGLKNDGKHASFIARNFLRMV